jgi:DNA-directed RNA polymerase specialized sigma24 family protein
MTGEPFESEWDKVRAVVLAYCIRAVRDNDFGKDIFQHVAIRAWRSYATFRSEASFLAWVMAIARNEVARETARRFRRQAREIALDESVENMLAAEGERPGSALASPPAIFQPVVDDARDFGALSPVEGQLLKLRLDRPEANWAELGAQAGVKESTAAALYCRAIPKLRVFLFLSRPDLLGGPASISAAFAAAKASSPGQLSSSEIECFDFMVVRRRTDYRRAGWRLHLRAACATVVRHLQPRPGNIF